METLGAGVGGVGDGLVADGAVDGGAVVRGEKLFDELDEDVDGGLAALGLDGGVDGGAEPVGAGALVSLPYV
jgi:hypothetical protein